MVVRKTSHQLPVATNKGRSAPHQLSNSTKRTIKNLAKYNAAALHHGKRVKPLPNFSKAKEKTGYANAWRTLYRQELNFERKVLEAKAMAMKGIIPIAKFLYPTIKPMVDNLQAILPWTAAKALTLANKLSDSEQHLETFINKPFAWLNPNKP